VRNAFRVRAKSVFQSSLRTQTLVVAQCRLSLSSSNVENAVFVLFSASPKKILVKKGSGKSLGMFCQDVIVVAPDCQQECLAISARL